MNKKEDFDKYFKHSALATILGCSSGKCLYANKAMENLLGYSAEELTQMNFSDFTHPEDVAYSNEKFQRFLNDNINSYQIEKRYIKKNKEVLNALTSVSIFDRYISNTTYIKQIQDISNIVRTKSDLKLSNERFERAIKGYEIGLWEWIPKSDEIYWSPKIQEITGYDENDKLYLLKNLDSLVHPDDREMREKKFKDHLENNTPFNIEYRLKNKRGQYVWLHSKGQSIRDDNGNVIKMYGSVEDISKRKEAEEALKENEERFALVVEGSRDGIWDWPDMTKDKQYWSVGYKKLLGYKDSEIDAKASTFFALLHPEDRHLPNDYLGQNLVHGETFDTEFRLKTKSGIYKWFQGKGIITIKNGIVRLTGSLTDIDTKKADEEKILEYTKELERINEDLDSFAYITSHDLKEPLRAISNQSFFLTEDYKDKIDEVGTKKLNRIVDLCARMEQLIDDILRCSKLKNQELVIKRIDLNKVIEDIKMTMESVITEQNVEIRIPNKLPKTICDEVTITEALRNLISNAIKYNQSENKIIEVGFTERPSNKVGTQYVFYIKDNGIGIEKKFYELIFSPFKRLDNLDKIIEGSGIGLHYVKRIVERHGGNVWVESEVGKGSTFFFTLN